MKRALLIAGGTVGGLGAVLSVTPPQIGDSGLSTLAGASAATSNTNSNTNSNLNNDANSANTNSNSGVTAAQSTTATKAAAIATKRATTTKKTTTTKKSTSTSTSASSTSSNTSSSNTSSNSSSSTSNNSANENVAPSPAPTPTPKKEASVSGSFTGDTINVGYGLVQVRITVSNGKITDATALQSPNGRSQRFSDYAIPNLRQQTLSAQSAAIRGVSGASYTSYGWYKSLISALNKAGMATGV